MIIFEHSSKKKYIYILQIGQELYIRDVHRGAAAKAVAAGFLKNHRGSGAAAAGFFWRILKNCMNLIEF